MVAENICEALRNYQPSPHYGQFESQGSGQPDYESPAAEHISFCPYCGSKQYTPDPNFCLVCGRKLSSTDNSSDQPNENADYYNNSSYGTRFSAGPGLSYGTGPAVDPGFSYGAGASVAMRSPARTNKEENASAANTSNVRMLPQIAVEITCQYCGAPTVVRTYRRFVRCPYCRCKIPFPGFHYKNIDRASDKYSSVEYWMSCPSCRGDNMCLWQSTDRWICQDCGYSITEVHRLKKVFWFCDDCETYMDVQTGFKQNRSDTWKCTECGFENDVSLNNIDE